MADSNNPLNLDYICVISPHEQKSNLEAVRQQAKAIQASAEAQNKLVTILQTQISLPKAVQKYYTSENVVLNKHTNWFVPCYPQQNPCLVCHYFGHNSETCPNIPYTAYNKCVRCWQLGHNFQSCQSSKVRPPFKNNFFYPNELLNRIF
ncbi:hypothetical protein C1645_739798 [Glomus cerebriforme]|uniref:CCHC-type domain-containing protein n=1 Tax=Glomus cerebriforme TaxID=658196 RepID=A0A397SQA2_9GLOM|nr:hypothetical protein C1645_739798 [Glomus cerebriforme]